MENLYIAISVMFPLFCMMILGYFLNHIGMMDKAFAKQLSGLCFNTFLPILLFMNIYNSDFYSLFSPKLVVFSMTSVTVAFLVLMAIIPKIVKKDTDKGVVIQGIFRSNFILFGVPIMASLYGPENTGTAAIVTAFVIPLFNLYSIIALNIFAGKDYNKATLIKKILKNPLIIATVLAFCFAITGIRLPVLVTGVLSDLAGIATPVALMTLGATFEFGNLKKYKELLSLAVLGKLIIIPGIFVPISIWLGFTGPALATLMIMFGSPTAVASFTMAQSVNANDELAGQIVVINSLLSIVTIVGWITVLKNLALI
ncbi:MAG: hypothetical protein ATN35_00905 [Epulopiscium sp. Nele67-Bin004]|nr:MAG: hypothetical protein ATN35_00905 [Epulopiscium sp. Nele67-Bin004]